MSQEHGWKPLRWATLMVPSETGREGLVSQLGRETRLSLGQSELSEFTPWTHRELVLAFK